MVDKIPASIRHNNPGCMWPGPSSEKFGAETHETLRDKQRNKIAHFPDPVSGAAAQFDLLNRVYVGRSIKDALATWGGGNYADEYTAVVCKRTGLKPDDRLTASYLKDPKTGVKFAKAMAFHETGYEYPLTDKQWKEAHAEVFGESSFKLPWTSKAPETLGERILARAITYVGETRISGKDHNQHLVDLFAAVGRPDVKDDDTAYCAAFAGAMAVAEGATIPPPDDALMARKYLNCGLEVPKDPEQIKPGDWIILPRGQAPWGHIGTVKRVLVSKRRVETVDGNVGGGKVDYRSYSIDSALGFRRPVVSKALPNGNKPIITTIQDSKTLRSLFNGFFAIVVGGALTIKEAINSAVDSVTNAVGTAIGVLPDAVSQTEQTVSLMQRTAAIFHVSWPLWLGVGAATATIAFAFFRGLGERRPTQ